MQSSIVLKLNAEMAPLLTEMVPMICYLVVLTQWDCPQNQWDIQSPELSEMIDWLIEQGLTHQHSKGYMGDENSLTWQVPVLTEIIPVVSEMTPVVWTEVNLLVTTAKQPKSE